MLSVSYVTCVESVAQVLLTRWSSFLILSVLTLKLRNTIIIILPTDPEKRKYFVGEKIAFIST